MISTRKTASAICALTLALGTAGTLAAAPLDGSTWQPVQIGGIDYPPDTEVSARFSNDGSLSGTGGCNSFFGTFTTDGDRIEIGPLGATLMACPEPVMKREAALLKALSDARSFAITDGLLILNDAENTAIARLARKDLAAMADLAGSEWRPADIAGFQIPGTADPFIRFESDSKLTGNAGCNGFAATFTTDGDKIGIGPVAVTRKACPEPLMTLESRFLKALAQARRFEVTRLSLTLLDGDNATVARLTRTDAD